MGVLIPEVQWFHLGSHRLQYLKWGVEGSPVVLLAGMGQTAHIYTELAPLLAQNHVVYALSRRGHGKSEMPPEGDFAPQALADDLLGFVEGLNLHNILLIGHSIAGNEMTLAATMQPERFAGLVYLDAAYDRSGVLDRIRQDPQIQQSKPQPQTLEGFRQDVSAQYGFWNAALEADLQDQLILKEGRLQLRPEWQNMLKDTHTFVPDYGGIRCPALAIYAPLMGHPVFLEQVMLPWQDRSIRQFSEQCAQGQVQWWPCPDHHFFVSGPVEVTKHILQWQNQYDKE